MSTQSRHIPGRQQTTCTEHRVTTLPPIRRACATHPNALYCFGWLCLSEPAVRNPPSTSVCCDRSTHTLDENVRTVWIKCKYLSYPYIFGVLCFLPEAHPRNLDISKHANNTALQSRPAAQAAGAHTTRVAGPWCASMASCLSPPPLSFLLCCCCACVCGVSFAPRK